jgi:hypothetical protein
MAMTSEELTANQLVQQLKLQVNQANGLGRAGLAALGGTALALLVGAVSRSIAKRTYLSALGKDPGHAHRIVVEQGILARLNVEVTIRANAAALIARANQNAKLGAMPNVLGKSTWGAPRPPSGGAV